MYLIHQSYKTNRPSVSTVATPRQEWAVVSYYKSKLLFLIFWDTRSIKSDKGISFIC